MENYLFFVTILIFGLSCFNFIFNLKENTKMADIADNVLATLAAVNALATAVSDLATKVAAIVPAPTDLTPLLTAINDGNKAILDAIAAESAKLDPTAAA